MMTHRPDTTATAWSARGSIVLGIITLIVLVGGFGVWSVTTTLSGAIIAQGRIEVEMNRQIVQHPDGGVVSDIFVTEGSHVKAGDVILRLDGALLKSELAIIEGQLFETMARRSRLEAERDGALHMILATELAAIGAARPDVANQIEGQRRLFSARAETMARTTDQLKKRRTQALSQIDGIDAQSIALKSQMELTGQELDDATSLLAKGLTQAARVMALRREQARLSGQEGELITARAQANGRVIEIDLEVLRVTAARREEASSLLRDIGASELELAERRSSLAARVALLDIRAPVSGTILGLQVTTPRAVLRPADQVAHIIPQDRPLIIATQISPLQIDEVHVGQAAILLFPTFSPRTTPELSGLITIISADALTDTASHTTYYRAEISLSSAEAARLGQTILPGMPVEAFIQTSPRTPLAYLIKPFTDYFTAAFRES